MKPTKVLFLISIIQLVLPLFLSAQIPFRVMSYNVENLFDTNDNPEKDDNDFLPEGNHYWNKKRYYLKLRQTAKVILAAGEWETPALIGICEIENDTVASDLITHTPLRNMNYQFCITDGPDRRGINVALLFQPDKFRKINQQSIPIRFTRKQHKITRDILYVSGLLVSGDTLDVFVCHFPSRYGGEKESEQDRIDAASTLRELSDSLSNIRQHPQLIAMGDFNDTPSDPSISQHLTKGCLYNLFATLKDSHIKGTHKYQDRWSLLDQMFTNLTANSSTGSLRLIEGSPRIFAPSFLLKDDKTWIGKRPFRTY